MNSLILTLFFVIAPILIMYLVMLIMYLVMKSNNSDQIEEKWSN